MQDLLSKKGTFGKKIRKCPNAEPKMAPYIKKYHTASQLLWESAATWILGELLKLDLRLGIDLAAWQNGSEIMPIALFFVENGKRNA